eukprot:1157557-Pelagomonas_calceolata.AAC.1
MCTQSAAWRKAKQPPRRQHHQAQVHQEQQEQRQQEGFALASPCGRSLAGSDISRSSDVFSLFLASNSPRSSLSCMRAQASKDSKLNYVPQTRRTQHLTESSFSGFTGVSVAGASGPSTCIDIALWECYVELQAGLHGRNDLQWTVALLGFTSTPGALTAWLP